MLASVAGAQAVRRPLRGRCAFAVLSHSWAGGHRHEMDSSGKTCVMLHGILGSKSNWNTPSKRLLEDIGPLGWRVLQLDHRGHGQSPGGSPPHSLESCAADVLETMQAAGVNPTSSEIVICGHSFGGKVALAVLRSLLELGAPPKMTWLLDSVPGCPMELRAEDARRQQSVGFVLNAVEAASSSGNFADRNALVEALTKHHGLVRPLAQWVAQTVRLVPGGGVALGYDMATVRALYETYRMTDMWPLLELGHADVGVVVAGRNRHAWGPDNLARLEACKDSRVKTVVLEHAGHNVHVDDLPGLLNTLQSTFE